MVFDIFFQERDRVELGNEHNFDLIVFQFYVNYGPSMIVTQ